MAENKDKDIVMKCRHMEKVYPGTKALDDVDFNIYRGKVNVLIGENGAGKSTLMKQIAGIEQPSSGKMYLDGEEVSFKNTTEARAKGVEYNTYKKTGSSAGSGTPGTKAR